MRFSLLVLAFSVGCAANAGAQSGTADTAFVRYARTHAVPLRTVAAGGESSDLKPLAALIGNARVVSLGEAAHGAHEPLAFRNRLFQYLVEELGFTAIAIESALPESRRILDYVAGANDDPALIMRQNFSWGFGNFGENAELLEWVRAYNASAAHGRKIKLYGMDLSLGGPAATTPTPTALEQVLFFLGRVDTASANRIHATLLPLLRRPLDLSAAPLTQSEQAQLTNGISEVVTLLERQRQSFTAATSPADWEWAHRNAMLAQMGDRMYHLTPPPQRGGVIPPEAWRAFSTRDSIMAENIGWILAQEGPRGRVLVFAHNVHVKDAPTEGGIWNAFAKPPTAMGQYLRRTLGNQLLIIGTSSNHNGSGLPAATPAPTSVDAALALTGLPLFLLDLRPARDVESVNSWLTAKHSLRANFTTEMLLPFGSAFDAVVYVDSLTAAHK